MVSTQPEGNPNCLQSESHYVPFRRQRDSGSSTLSLETIYVMENSVVSSADDQADDIPKVSGVHNLLRYGWSEERCRNYIIRQAEWIPRNFHYADGLARLHPLLQEAFGDENMDLALGVLDELIELSDKPPFPYCLFQRWKFAHRRRYDNFELPHVPHASVITRPAIKTKTHLQYLDESQNKPSHDGPSLADSPDTSPIKSPTSPIFTGPAAHALAKNPGWRFGAGGAISAKGKQTIHYCPTPEEYHKRLWDDNYGRGGKMVRFRNVSISELQRATDQTKPGHKTPKKNFYIQIIKEFFFKDRSKAKWEASRTKSQVSTTTQNKPATVETLAFDLKRRLQEEHFPNHGEVPNAAFARKFNIIPKEVVLPPSMNRCLQISASDKDSKRLDELWKLSHHAATKERKEVRELFAQATSNCTQPLSPSLFADRGNDYCWSVEGERVAKDKKPSIYLDAVKTHKYLGRHTDNNAHVHGDNIDTYKESARHSSKHSYVCGYDNTRGAGVAAGLPGEQGTMKPALDSRLSSANITDMMQGFQNQPLVALGNDAADANELPILTNMAYNPKNETGTKTFSAGQGGAMVINNLLSRSADAGNENSPNYLLSPVAYSKREMGEIQTPPGFLNPISQADNSTEADTSYLLNPVAYSPPEIGKTETPLWLLTTASQVETLKTSSLTKTALASQTHKSHPKQLKSYSNCSGVYISIPESTNIEKSISGAVHIEGSMEDEGKYTMSYIDAQEELEDSYMASTSAVRPQLVTVRIWKEIKVENSLVAKPKPQHLGLDGAGDEVYPEDRNSNNNKRYHFNRNNNETLSTIPVQKVSMDLHHGYLWPPYLSSPKPLQVRKQPSQVHCTSQQQLHNNPYKQPPDTYTPRHPPRTSSVCKFDQHCDPEPIHCYENSRGRVKSEAPVFTTSGPQSTVSSYTGNSHFNSPVDGHFSATAAPSPISTHKSRYFTDASTGIMGDFVPIDSLYMNTAVTPAKGVKGFYSTMLSLDNSKRVVNPYEFESVSPIHNEARQTTFTDFIQGRGAEFPLSPRPSHMRNSRSEGNATYTPQSRPLNLNVSAPSPSSYALHKSESSPSIEPKRFPQSYERISSPDISPYYYGETEESTLPSRRGQPSENITNRGRQHQDFHTSRSTHGYHTQRQDLESPAQSRALHSAKTPPYSPTRLKQQRHARDSYENSPTRNCHRTKSPNKTLEDVFERDEYEITPGQPSRSPTMKRSRSPMKKMFGEHGWLGQSPNELKDLKVPMKKAFSGRKEDNGNKKSTVMRKLKTKLEEFAEKADLSPIRRSRSNADKHPKISVLSVSLGPPEQARIYMEVELMLVHTANNFLMNQFSQGRIAVDSIKKTVDVWKGRGRPIVIEFMYDQVTQRDLVAVNQHNFRFHGNRASNGIRVNSMLYNWKQVANLMAVRTFCDADTVILKLLYDIEQILELLGAGEGIMLRLQQIRALAKESMRIARQKTDGKSTTQSFPKDGETEWITRTSSSSKNPSIEDPYGGLKLVPDSYSENT